MNLLESSLQTAQVVDVEAFLMLRISSMALWTSPVQTAGVVL